MAWASLAWEPQPRTEHAHFPSPASTRIPEHSVRAVAGVTQPAHRGSRPTNPSLLPLLSLPGLKHPHLSSCPAPSTPSCSDSAPPTLTATSSPGSFGIQPYIFHSSSSKLLPAVVTPTPSLPGAAALARGKCCCRQESLVPGPPPCSFHKSQLAGHPTPPSRASGTSPRTCGDRRQQQGKQEPSEALEAALGVTGAPQAQALQGGMERLSPEERVECRWR